MSAALTNTNQHIQSGSRKDQIKKLLSSGVRPSIVANTVGVDPSYITQLMAEEEFMREVVESQVANLQKLTTRDNKYDDLEDKLLEGLEAKIEGGISLWKPDAILRAITVINNAKRRGSQNDQPLQAPTTIVQLILPQVALQTFRMNPTAEVIEVDGKNLTSMSASRILARLEATPAPDSNLVSPTPQELLAKPHEQVDPQQRRISDATISAEKV